MGMTPEINDNNQYSLSWNGSDPSWDEEEEIIDVEGRVEEEEQEAVFRKIAKIGLENQFSFSQFSSVSHTLQRAISPNCLTPPQAPYDNVEYFEVFPLEIGQGITLGSTLRRAILGQTSGSAVVGFRFNEAKHEFSSSTNVKEDLLEIAGNLQQIKFFHGCKKASVMGRVMAIGPKIITAGMFEFPFQTIEILNKEQYICTVTEGYVFLEIRVQTAAGYKNAVERNPEIYGDSSEFGQEIFEASHFTQQRMMKIDANFSPVKAVNYKVTLAYDIKGNLSEKVVFTVATTGTYLPKHAIQDGTKEILNLFYPLLFTEDLFEIGAQLVAEKSFVDLEKARQKENYLIEQAKRAGGKFENEEDEHEEGEDEEEEEEGGNEEEYLGN